MPFFFFFFTIDFVTEPRSPMGGLVAHFVGLLLSLLRTAFTPGLGTNEL